MYRKIIIVILLSGCISPSAILTSAQEAETDTQGVDPIEETTLGTTIGTVEGEEISVTRSQPLPEEGKGVPPKEETTPDTAIDKVEREEFPVTRRQPLPEGEKGGRKQIEHMFSEPVITVIIFGVMAGIIGITLFIAFCIGRLRKKTSFDVQPPFLHDTGVPLSLYKQEIQ